MEEKLPQEEENLPNNVEEELVFGYGAGAIFGSVKNSVSI